MFQLYLMYSILLKSVVHGHGGGTCLGTCLVYATCVVAFVACVNGDQVLFYTRFYCTGCARAWTRQAPWYMPCARAACLVCREFAICAYV